MPQSIKRRKCTAKGSLLLQRVKGSYLSSKIFSTEKLTEDCLFNTHNTSYREGLNISLYPHGELVSTQSNTTSQRLQLKVPQAVSVIAIHTKPGRETQAHVLWCPPCPGHGCSQPGTHLPFTNRGLPRSEDEHPHLYTNKVRTSEPEGHTPKGLKKMYEQVRHTKKPPQS